MRRLNSKLDLPVFRDRATLEPNSTEIIQFEGRKNSGAAGGCSDLNFRLIVPTPVGIPFRQLAEFVIYLAGRG